MTIRNARKSNRQFGWDGALILGAAEYKTSKLLVFRSMKFYFELRNGDEQEEAELSKKYVSVHRERKRLGFSTKKTAPPWVAVENLLAKHL
jgi:hypothetical protein